MQFQTSTIFTYIDLAKAYSLNTVTDQSWNVLSNYKIIYVMQCNYNAQENSVITIITHWVTFYYDVSLSKFDKVSLSFNVSDFILNYLFLIKMKSI